ncbi:MAG: 4Fe-4S binding protein [Candidatus Marinimicrobia bacterium]|nr:4Fe-4S binding protein [Candidatus Neomarinimicrobiota bacterium]
MSYKNNLNAMEKAKVKCEECIGCGACVEVCQYRCFRYSLKGHCWFPDQNCCVGCGACIPICPVEALYME